jgi:hypothetical protein
VRCCAVVERNRHAGKMTSSSLSSVQSPKPLPHAAPSAPRSVVRGWTAATDATHITGSTGNDGVGGGLLTSAQSHPSLWPSTSSHAACRSSTGSCASISRHALSSLFLGSPSWSFPAPPGWIDASGSTCCGQNIYATHMDTYSETETETDTDRDRERQRQRQTETEAETETDRDRDIAESEVMQIGRSRYSCFVAPRLPVLLAVVQQYLAPRLDAICRPQERMDAAIDDHSCHRTIRTTT